MSSPSFNGRNPTPTPASAAPVSIQDSLLPANSHGKPAVGGLEGRWRPFWGVALLQFAAGTLPFWARKPWLRAPMDGN